MLIETHRKNVYSRNLVIRTKLHSHDMQTGELVLEYTVTTELSDGWIYGRLYDIRDEQIISRYSIEGGSINRAQREHDQLIQHANTLHRTRQNRINSLVMQARKGVRC